MKNFQSRVTAVSLTAALLGGCTVGPKYKRPAAIVPPAFKEAPPEAFKEQGEWKLAEPKDGAPRGNWWEIYKDEELNALVSQVSISNQNVLAFEAQFRRARDQVRIDRSALFPTVSVVPGLTQNRYGNTSFNQTGTPASVSGITNIYSAAGQVSWTADIWGSIRGTVRADVNLAQATAAQLESAKLAYQSTLAQYYYQVRGLDGARDLLERTVASFQEYLQLTRDRFEFGVATDADVAQAEAQLESTRLALVDLAVTRAQFEHAIATLIGKPPSDVNISRGPITILSTLR